MITPVVKFFELTLHVGFAFSQLLGVLLMNWLHAVELPAMNPVYALSHAWTWIPYFAASVRATSSGSCDGRAPPSAPHMRGEQGSMSEKYSASPDVRTWKYTTLKLALAARWKIVAIFAKSTEDGPVYSKRVTQRARAS